MTNLEYLICSGSGITQDGIGGLKKLKHFDFRECEGVYDISHLVSLKYAIRNDRLTKEQQMIDMKQRKKIDSMDSMDIDDDNDNNDNDDTFIDSNDMNNDLDIIAHM